MIKNLKNAHSGPCCGVILLFEVILAPKFGFPTPKLVWLGGPKWRNSIFDKFWRHLICMRISIKCICALRDRKPEKHFYTENCPKTWILSDFCRKKLTSNFNIHTWACGSLAYMLHVFLYVKSSSRFNLLPMIHFPSITARKQLAGHSSIPFMDKIC